VPVGAVSDPIELADHAAIDPTTGRTVMTVRVVQVDEGAAAPAPSLRLAGANGPPAPVTTNTPISAAGTPIALATCTDGGGDIHRVEIEVLQHQATWQLQIGNTDNRPHRYVVVAGSTDAATRQPWLDLTVGVLEFVVNSGETAPPQELRVANHGSGPLTLADPDGADLGTGFTLLTVTPRPIAGNGSGVARIGFTTPAEPGQQTITHTFASNDPGAGATTGHNNGVALSATVRPGPRWAPGDILMLGESTLGRLNRTTGQPVPVTTETAGAVDVAVDPTTGDAVLLGSGFVKRVNRFTGAQTPFSGVSLLTAPVGLAVDRDGTVVVLDKSPGSLVRIKPDGTRDTIGASGLGRVQDVALEANGDVVVACGGPGGFGPDAKVMRISRSGTITTVAAGGDLSGPVGGPLAVTVEPDGTILTARQFQGAGGGFTFSEGTLIRVAPQSGAQTHFTGSFELVDPAALAVAVDGTILVFGSRGLFAVHPQTKALTRLSSVTGGRIAVVPPLDTP
jgi:hypothetical protein